MSASQEKKARERAEREEKRLQQEKADRRAMTLYTVVGAVVVLAAIIMMVWSSGVIQRGMTAVEAGGEKFNAGDLQYYFSGAYNRQRDSYGMFPFNTTVSLKDQVYDQETGQSWHDYLVDQAVHSLAADTALAKRAASEGYTLSEAAQRELDEYTTQLKNSRLVNGDQFIRANYGPYMSFDQLLGLVQREITASDYAEAQADKIDHPKADYDAYYSEHSNELDTLTFSLFAFQARANATDADGNPVQLTPEATAAALEESKAEQSALAQELLDKLSGGTDLSALEEEYGDNLISTIQSRSAMGSTVSQYTYGDWLLDAARRPGDAELIESDTGSACYYYVVLFEGRELDKTPTANIRHILVGAELDSGADQPTQAQYDAAYQEAQDLLDEWKAGQATEDSFAALATEHSADTGSAQNGGLMESVSATAGYVQTFTDWALDPSRRPGDTGIVQNTGSSTKGWHIMYYVGENDPIWEQVAAAQLRNQDLEALDAQALEGMSVSTGTGVKFLTTP